ncbi:DUF4085 family protein [Paenibacillus sp. GSMTC-2017]|uniref:DUF4085 family protein n=1 Tax=Paenibacillus sp. GSMTC-2017 TaxID=2794350 RepID=UPI0018D7148A|nr:DUF4085 family protein [Paenibacillus sp. GSMTC-2017]MBH5319970.1 DUF4085 family protein [Paenibacillus sp. GSMTC-2017]
MKYFTTELYEKMQVRGFLVLPDTEKDFEFIKERYVEHGRDFEKVAMMQFETYMPLLTKYASDSILALIKNGELPVIHYPKPETRRIVKAWRDEQNEEWNMAARRYGEGFVTYEKKLPPAYKSIHYLHDSKVLDVQIGEDGNIELLLDSSGSMYGGERVFLLFHNVSDYEIPDDLIGNWWLYEEMYWNEEDGSCSVNVLLSSPRGYLDMNVLKINAKHFTVDMDWTNLIDK